MKTLRKLLVGLLVVAIMAVGLATSAFAVIETEPGKTVTVSFDIESSYAINGYFEFSNRAMFDSFEFSQDSTFTGELSYDKVYIFGKESTAVSIKLDAVVSSSAKPGDSCEIVFHYEVGDKDGNMSGGEATGTGLKTRSETDVIIDVPPTSDAAVAVIAAAAVIALGGAVIVGKANRA